MKNKSALFPVTAVIGFFILSVSFFSVSSLGGHSSAQTNPSVTPFPSVTPCRSGSPLSVNYNPCNTPKPTPLSAEELAKREKQKADWEDKIEKLLTAKYPLTNETSIDVDGNGKPDKILYQINRWEQDFEGLLEISSENGEVLWKHEFFMAKRDLVKFLTEVLEYDSINDWVGNVFNEKGNYAFKASNRKLKANEISQEQIEYIAKTQKINVKTLQSEILEQKTNYIFAYRAEWREDYLQIVFVPSLKKFVCFARGY